MLMFLKLAVANEANLASFGEYDFNDLVNGIVDNPWCARIVSGRDRHAMLSQVSWIVKMFFHNEQLSAPVFHALRYSETAERAMTLDVSGVITALVLCISSRSRRIIVEIAIRAPIQSSLVVSCLKTITIIS